jgi:sulfoxide reductase heme-binding subunit YedZ
VALARHWSWWVKTAAIAGAVATALVALFVAPGQPLHETVTDISGDVAVVLIAVTLLGRPVLLALGRRAPSHLPWRRDVGVGAGLLALSHVACGFRIHLGGEVLEYFNFGGDGRFAAANALGAASALGLAAVTVVSNRAAMRRLRGRRWKRIQSLVLPALGLALIHVVLYAKLNGRTFVAVSMAVLVALVLVARWSWRPEGGAPSGSRGAGA